jgi:hypothetical protein
LKEELKTRITKIWHIMQAAKESFYYSYYLHKPDSEEENSYVNTSTHFKFIRIALWKLTVIELAKLFNRVDSQDKFNLNKLLLNLKSGGHFRTLNFDQKKIVAWEESLKSNEVTIQEIIKLRDKVYSHTDPNSDSYKNSHITFEQTELLIKLCEEIIVSIYAEVFDTYASMDFVYFNKSFKNVTKILSKEKKDRIDKMIENYKNTAGNSGLAK